MPKDAKLGLVIGIGLLIVIAAIFFRRDAASAKAPPEQTAAASVRPAGSSPAIADSRRR
jgi:hypothetical protein